MFFADPGAAFTHVARAARPGARLVMLVWQAAERNEWATAIRQALPGVAEPVPMPGLDPFSMADPDVIRSILGGAGFVDVEAADVHEPVHYGPDVRAALDLVLDMRPHRDAIARLEAAAAQRALVSSSEMLAAHETPRGVLFDARAWLVTARVAGPAKGT